MSAPAPATRRSGSGSRRFNPLRVLQPKRRLLPEPRPPAVSVATETGLPDRATPPVPRATPPVPIPVPPAPAFDYCRFIELDYVPMESGYMVSMRPTKHQATPTKHQATPTKQQATPKSQQTSSRSPSKSFSERHNSAPTTPRVRRTASSRENFSLCSSSSGSCKGSDCSRERERECSPTKGRLKLKSCTENHGIRPPPPEQYLTPLQQKEVCIRHLRSKLRETIDTLQNRDSEIDELRERLTRMQEDWVEEECHRVEAQLALKEARAEIQALKTAVGGVRARLGDAGDAQDINSQNHRLETLLLNMEEAGLQAERAGLQAERAGLQVERAGLGFRTRLGGSAPASVSGESPVAAAPRTTPGGTRGGACSCSSSPARTLPRSCTYTKLTERALAERSHEFGTQDSGFVCESGENDGGQVPTRADLLLEAAFLSEETASLLSTYTQTFASLPAPSAPSITPHVAPQGFSSHSCYSQGYSAQTLPHSFPRSHGPHALPHSSTCEGLCSARAHPEMSSLHCGLSSLACLSHPCLSHHHLYLHQLREAGIQTESCPIPAESCPIPAESCPVQTESCPVPASDLDTIAEIRTFRSQACSPTSTWASDDCDELSTASLTTATVMSAATEPVRGTTLSCLAPVLPRSATVWGSMEGPLCRGENQESENQGQENQESENQGRENQESGNQESENQGRENQDSENQGRENQESGNQESENQGRENQESKNQGRENQESGNQESGNQESENQGRENREERESLRSDGSQFEATKTSEATLSEGKSKAKDSTPAEPTAAAGKQQQQKQQQQQQHVGANQTRPTAPLIDHSEGRVESDRSDKTPGDGNVPDSAPDSAPAPVAADDLDVTTCTELEELSFPALSPDEPQTSQPKSSASPEPSARVAEPASSEEGGAAAAGAEPEGLVQRSYWSRHFLVDLLAVAIPVVPTVAWLCRGPVRDGQPMYHIGSLLRGCCTVALTSLRRSGGMRHYPAGGGGPI